MTDAQNYRLSLRAEKLEHWQMKKNDQLTSQDAKLHPHDRETM